MKAHTRHGTMNTNSLKWMMDARQCQHKAKSNTINKAITTHSTMTYNGCFKFDVKFRSICRILIAL